MKKISVVLGILVSSLCVSANSKNLNSDISLVGTINIAVLNTAVDNKQQSDHTLIEATITDGKYKGAKLNGELVNVPGPPKVALNQHRLIFTSMRISGERSPIKINAYAIDPDTARTALTSKVDKDYLDRNGSILAVSFVQSYSKPWYLESNDNPTKAIMPARVKIDSGTNMGILFMSKKA